MHGVLARDTDVAEFKPEPADHAAMDAWAEGAIEQIDLAVQAIGRVQDWPSDEVRAQAESFVTLAGPLSEAARRLVHELPLGTLQTRVHGDFHLGQVLVTPGDATIIDFEGEPAKTMEQRRAKSCALRDVAGMLRSFDYAAATAADVSVPGSAPAAGRRSVLMGQFRTRAAAAFLDCYKAVQDAAPARWIAEKAQGALLDLFLLEKASYEIRYEAANRPAWIGIPLAGALRIAQRLIDDKGSE